MFSLVKDIASVIAIATVFAFSNGDYEWIWRESGTVRTEVMQLVRQDWGCPSIFSKTACGRRAKGKE